MSDEVTEPRVAQEVAAMINEVVDGVAIDASHEIDDSGLANRKPPGKTVIKLDKWSLRRGVELLSENETIRTSMATSGIVNETAELAAADFLSAAFEPSIDLHEACIDSNRKMYVEQMLSTQAFVDLHVHTQLDDVASEIAAVSFIKSYSEFVVRTSKMSDDDKEIEAAGDAGSCCAGATKEVQEYKDMKESMGLGGDSTSPTKINDERLKKMFGRVRSDKMLRAVMSRAGKLIRVAQSLQRKKAKHGMDDVVNVTTGGLLEHILPQELCMLADEEMELEGMRRIAERSYFCRDYHAVEPLGKGPVVVVVDESGSMNGSKIIAAKSVALAAYYVARHQKRWMCLVGFSGSSDGNWLTLQPGESRPDEIMDWIEHFFSGGTDLDVPLVVLPEKWDKLGAPAGKTDIVFITDCIVTAKDKIIDDFLAWKEKSQAEVTTIVIGESKPGDMERISEHCYSVTDLDPDSPAVHTVLSI